MTTTQNTLHVTYKLNGSDVTVPVRHAATDGSITMEHAMLIERETTAVYFFA